MGNNQEHHQKTGNTNRNLKHTINNQKTRKVAQNIFYSTNKAIH